MSKKEVREDTYAWMFAAHVSVVVIGSFLLAVGLDLYHAVQSVSTFYAGAI